MWHQATRTGATRRATTISILSPGGGTFLPATSTDRSPEPAAESGSAWARLALWFDGACEPVNPGGTAVFGWLTCAAGEIVDAGRGVSCSGPKATKNVAEYEGLEAGLLWLADSGATGRLSIYGDSRLVLGQVSGDWACNAAHLRELRDRCRELLARVCPGGDFTLTFVPRDQSGEADALARAAYLEHLGQPVSGRLLHRPARSAQ